MRDCAFFSPRLDPVLDRAKGHKDAVVSPQVPTRWPVGQPIFHHDPHGNVNDAVGVSALGRRQVGEVCGEVAATGGTVILRIGDLEVFGPSRPQVAEVMQESLLVPIAIGPVPTVRTEMSFGVALTAQDLGRWQVLNTGDAFRGIGSILTGSEHDRLLLTNKVRTSVYAEKHFQLQTKPGSDTTVSIGRRAPGWARIGMPCNMQIRLTGTC